MEFLSNKKENQKKILSFLDTNYCNEIDDII